MKKLSATTLLVLVCFCMIAAIGYSLCTSIWGSVSLGEYKGLDPQTISAEITNEDITNAIDQVRMQFATKQKVTQGAAPGDTLMVDYVATENGAPREDYTDTQLPIVLGQEDFVVKGMDEYLVGANVGQTVTATLTVPETHHVAEDIGKTFTFQVTVKEIERTVLPELTDEFVKTLGDYSSVADFKTKFEQQYRAEKEEEHKAQYRSTLFAMAVENATVVRYPVKEIDRLVDQWNTQVQAGADEMGMSFTDYASFAYGLQGLAQCKDQALSYAQEVAKQELVLQAIAKKEKVKVTEEEYKTYYADYLAMFTAEEFTEEYMVEYYGGEEGLKQQFLMEKVADVLEQNAAQHS